ncbi:MAG: hypothetical protein LBU89_11955 [Fibromonadaceae bacterium]|jgi:hypothetical protein|nr:hypothetical protein [Fibromonadaceae bacterium]
MSDKPTPTKDTSVAVGASIELLGFDMNAMLAVTEENDIRSVKALVMPGITNSPQEITMKDLIDAFKEHNLEIPEEGLKNALKYAGFGNDLNGIKIRLNQAFALYDSSITEKSKALEFAFSISITSAKGTQEGDAAVFEIKSLSFAIWNTTRQGVLSTLGMGNIDDLVKKLQ